MSLRLLDADREIPPDRTELLGPSRSEILSADAAEHAEWFERRRALERRRLRSTPDGPRPPTETPRPLLTALQLGLKLTGLWRRGVANGLDVRLHTLTLEVPGLPAAFHGYRVLQIADPHLDAAPGLAEAILRSVTGIDADLCVFTGDFRATDQGRFRQTGILEPLAAIRAAVRVADGFLATLGNHDPADTAPHLERLGFELLINRSRYIWRGTERIAVTGVDDVHRYYTPAALAALATHDRALFGITLAHSPELAGEAALAGYRLYLCGHTHGGQVCLPGGRPVITHLARHRDLHSGLWQHRGMTGYTSRGAGVSSLPVRFNCPPEVTLFTLAGSADRSVRNSSK